MNADDDDQFDFFDSGAGRVLKALGWGVVFLCALRLFHLLSIHQLVAVESEDIAYLVFGGLVFMSFSAAVGSLFGRALWGAGFGIVVFLLYVGWILFALNTFTPI